MKDDEPIYYCDWSQQPDIHIVGIGLSEWTTPAWRNEFVAGLPEGVYLADNKKLYTFDSTKVTAPESLGWLAYMSLKK